MADLRHSTFQPEWKLARLGVVRGSVFLCVGKILVESGQLHVSNNFNLLLRMLYSTYKQVAIRSTHPAVSKFLKNYFIKIIFEISPEKFYHDIIVEEFLFVNMLIIKHWDIVRLRIIKY